MSVRVAESHSGEPRHNGGGKLPGQDDSSAARSRAASPFLGSGNLRHAGVIFIFFHDKYTTFRTEFHRNLADLTECVTHNKF